MWQMHFAVGVRNSNLLLPARRRVFLQLLCALQGHRRLRGEEGPAPPEDGLQRLPPQLLRSRDRRWQAIRQVPHVRFSAVLWSGPFAKHSMNNTIGPALERRCPRALQTRELRTMVPAPKFKLLTDHIREAEQV